MLGQNNAAAVKIRKIGASISATVLSLGIQTAAITEYRKFEAGCGFQRNLSQRALGPPTFNAYGFTRNWL
jgi:hypothetical protein